MNALDIQFCFNKCRLLSFFVKIFCKLICKFYCRNVNVDVSEVSTPPALTSTPSGRSGQQFRSICLLNPTL